LNLLRLFAVLLKVRLSASPTLTTLEAIGRQLATIGLI